LLAILAGACIVPGAVMFKIITTDLSVYMGEMSAGVAHELNSPLPAIVGNSQLLFRETTPEDW